MLVTTSFAQIREVKTNVFAQSNSSELRGDREVVPVGDFTVTDINGNEHHLQDYLDAGKYVVIDFSASWCGPCWSLHQSHVLDNLYNTYGPGGTDELVVLWIEVDPNTTLADIQGTTGMPNGQHDWTVGGTWPIPIINDGSPTSAFPTFDGRVPAVFGVCPEGGYLDVTEAAWTNAEAVFNSLTADCPTNTDLPIAYFTGSTNAFTGDELQFTNRSISAIPATFEWTFEGANIPTSTDSIVTVKWDEPGEYKVKLVVTNANGADSLEKTITINTADIDNYNLTFEECLDFAGDMLPYDWTVIDGDDHGVYGSQDVDFPGEGEKTAFRVMSYSGLDNADGWQPATGDNLAAAFACLDKVTNNDWLISPKFTVEPAHHLFTFKAKSITAQYGLERFKVAVSTTDNMQSSFTFISEGDYLEAPVEWTDYSFELLDDYAGQEVYVAIQCVSYDAYAFLLDDVKITGEDANDEVAVEFGIYPNPSTGIVNLRNAENANVRIINNLGQVVLERNNISNNELFDLSEVAAGSYIMNVRINNSVYNKHLILLNK